MSICVEELLTTKVSTLVRPDLVIVVVKVLSIVIVLVGVTVEYKVMVPPGMVMVDVLVPIVITEVELL